MDDKPTTTVPDMSRRHRWAAVMALGAVLSALTLTSVMAKAPSAHAVEAPVDLGTASSFSVLGGESVTNTGDTTMNGDLGVSPGSSITGFPPGMTSGTVHATDAVAAEAQSDLTTAYNDAAGRASTGDIPVDPVGMTLVGGVYTSPGTIGLSGTLTLDGQGDPNTVWIFQTSSTLITASDSTINLINSARACNVFWQVGSSATIGTNTDFVGTIMALTSISVQSGADVEGRALARTGSVTLDNNTFVTEECEVIPTTTTTDATTTTTTTGATTTTTGATTTTTGATTTTTGATTTGATTTTTGAATTTTGTTTTGTTTTGTTTTGTTTTGTTTTKPTCECTTTTTTTTTKPKPTTTTKPKPTGECTSTTTTTKPKPTTTTTKPKPTGECTTATTTKPSDGSEPTPDEMDSLWACLDIVFTALTNMFGG